MRHQIESLQDMINILKYERKKLKVSQIDLANFTGLSNHGISKIELGKSDLKFSTIMKIADLLGLKIYLERDEER